MLDLEPETLRGWVERVEIDAGARPGVTTEEHSEIVRLKKENAELRRASEILETASASFAAAELAQSRLAAMVRAVLCRCSSRATDASMVGRPELGSALASATRQWRLCSRPRRGVVSTRSPKAQRGRRHSSWPHSAGTCMRRSDSPADTERPSWGT